MIVTDTFPRHPEARCVVEASFLVDRHVQHRLSVDDVPTNLSGKEPGA